MNNEFNENVHEGIPMDTDSDRSEETDLNELNMLDNIHRIENYVQRSETENISMISNSETSVNSAPQVQNTVIDVGENSHSSDPNVSENVLLQTRVEDDNEKELRHKDKKRKSTDIDHEEDDEDDDGSLCVICFDHWTNSGDHHLTSLKCGHLFGHKCILRWLSSQTKKSCPTCKSKASVNDLRSIYAKKIITLDTSELNRLQEELEITKQEKNKLYMEVTRLSCVTKLQQDKIDALNNKIDEFKNQSKTIESKPVQNASNIELIFIKNMEICKDGECRVMCYNNDNLLAVTSKSPNNLFSSYGIRKIDTNNFTLSQFVPLHSQVIRDLAFHPQTGEWLLSASVDKTAKLINVVTNNVIVTFTTEMPLWSCTWDADNPNILFVGGQRGSVIQYDVREPNVKLNVLNIPNDMSPVVSLASVEAYPGNSLPRGGILCCKLTSCWVFENQLSGYVEKKLPLDGPFISLCYDKATKQVLTSTRPNQQNINCRHIVCHIENGPGNSLVCNTVHCFQGGTSQTMLSKTRQISLKNEMLIAAYQETKKSFNMWSINTGRLAYRMSVDEPIMDICHISDSCSEYLAILSEKRIKIFKFK